MPVPLVGHAVPAVTSWDGQRATKGPETNWETKAPSFNPVGCATQNRTRRYAVADCTVDLSALAATKISASSAGGFHPLLELRDPKFRRLL